MLSQSESKARVLSQVLDFFHRHHWEDSDDFSLRVVERIHLNIVAAFLPYSAIWSATETKTRFFVVNHVTRREFCDAFIKELTPYLKEIGVASSLGALSFGEIFPEAKNVKLDEAEKLVNLNAMAIDERAIQDAFRRSLREKGATNMVERKSESSLEIADLEDFTLKIGGRDVSFTCVVKGYKSINGQRVTFEQIAHQIFKAFDGTFPDYIILALAKPPTDAVISHLVRFGESVGNRNLLVWADPIELCRFLRARGVI